MTAWAVRGLLGQRLAVAIDGYEQASARDRHDANWLRCSVEAELGHIRGVIDVSLTTHELEQFGAALERVVRGEVRRANFAAMETALAIDIEVDPAGRVVVSGTVRELGEHGAAITFRFDSDRSLLDGTSRELKRALAQFPPRGVQP